ncbi:MAG: hypothetical protein IJ520_00835 [Synergistaceae bacterium]|nr:hypothetical protein [Synergistaceae bacterium]
MNLDYWVFTSGEKGVHELDWGIKHASPAFADRLALDINYRTLLNEFSLPPSLEHPGNGIGLLLLPYEGGASLLGFVFPGTDHRGRLNTAAVVCAVPESVSRQFSIADAARLLWESNDLESIALNRDAERPKVLAFNGEHVISSEAPAFTQDVSWPSDTVGYIQANGKLKKLTRIIPQKPKDEKHEKSQAANPRSLPLKKAALLLAVMAVFGLGAAMMLNSNTQEEAATSPVVEQEQEQVRMPQPASPVAEQEQGQVKMPLPDIHNEDTEAKHKAELERMKREKQEEKERKEREERKKEEERQRRKKEAEAKKAREAEEKANAAKAKLMQDAKDIWRSLGLSDAHAGAFVDVLLAKNFESVDYGRQFESVMDIAAIKARLDKIIKQKEDKGDYISVRLTSAGAWKDFKSSWADGTVFDANKLSPSSEYGAAEADRIYEKLAEILTQLDGRSAEIVFIFRTSDKRLNLMFRRMVNSKRNIKECYILTKDHDFMETDLHIFDGVKQLNEKTGRVRVEKSDTRLGSFFSF